MDLDIVKLKRILEFITVMRRMKTKHKKVGQPTVPILKNIKKSRKAQNTAFLKKAFETAAPLFEEKTLLFKELMIK